MQKFQRRTNFHFGLQIEREGFHNYFVLKVTKHKLAPDEISARKHSEWEKESFP